MGIPAHNLIHTAVVVAPAVATDAYGNETRDYGGGATRTTISCRLQQDPATERFPEARNISEQRWLMFANYALITDIDQIEWADHPTGPVVFEVFGAPDPQYGASTFNHGQIPLRILAG